LPSQSFQFGKFIESESARHAIVRSIKTLLKTSPEKKTDVLPFLASVHGVLKILMDFAASEIIEDLGFSWEM
jgi:hypothetical protein